MQDEEKRTADAGTHRAVYRRETVSESQPRKDDSGEHQQGEISWLWLLPCQGEVQDEDSPEVGDKDAEQAQRAYGQRKPMEQPGAGKETTGVRQRMGKLLPNGGYEAVDEANRRVAAAQDPSGVLEAMAPGVNPVPNLPGTTPGGMAGTRTGELSKRHVESGRYAEHGADKRNTGKARISIHAGPVSESM